MLIDHPRSLEERIGSAVDAERGLVARSIFADEGVYQLEQERIFRRCWLFLAHESQIPGAGDYVTTKMAETSVIVCRDHNGRVNALINSCRHRGNTVCRSDYGNARTFTCAYHGWCYDLQGKRVEPGTLVAVPGHKSYYDEKLALDDWGLVPLAKTESYRGLIFGTFDPEAPSLREYLNDFTWALDLMLDRGDLRAAPGIVRWRMPCNWKFPADNAADNAHAQITHRSAFIAMSKLGGASIPVVGAKNPGFTILTEYGHLANFQTGSAEDVGKEAEARKSGYKYATPGLEYWRTRPEIVEQQGPFRTAVLRYNMNVFPNLFVIDRLLMLRNPVGPRETEIRIIGLFDASTPPEVQREEQRGMFRKFGPSGFLEMEDGDNFDQSTQGVQFGPLRDYDLNYTMGLGSGEFVRDAASPPRVETMLNEHGQLWFYRTWSEAMQAADWAAYASAHSRPGARV